MESVQFYICLSSPEPASSTTYSIKLEGIPGVLIALVGSTSLNQLSQGSVCHLFSWSLDLRDRDITESVIPTVLKASKSSIKHEQHTYESRGFHPTSFSVGPFFHLVGSGPTLNL